MVRKEGRYTLQIYYVVRPKHGLVLDAKLRWMKPSECAGAGSGEALGLEMTDSLNVAAWVSFDGVSAVPYPEATACSLFGKNAAEKFVFSSNKKTYTHSDFVNAVDAGFFPGFLLRKPLNKAEKKLMLGSYGKVRLKPNFVSSEFVPPSKADLRGDGFSSKGAENMFYLVNTKRNLFLTKSLSWIDIGSIRKNKKLMSQLFCVRDDITAAQTVALWLTPPGESIFPCTSSTLKRKYRLTFSKPTSDFLTEGIYSRKLPSFLSRKPHNRKEVIAFQVALRGGLKGLEERTLQSLGGLSAEESEAESVAVALPTVVESPISGDTSISNEDLSSTKDGELLPCGSRLSEEECNGNEQFSFHHHTSSVAESSDLIRSVIETSIMFGKMVSDAQGLIAQRRLDLEMIQRQLLDLDHVAEFYSLNASDGFRMNRTRKEYLQKRRIIKDELIVLNMVIDYLSNGVTPNSIDGFVNGIMNLDRRCYTTRALTVSEVKHLIRNPKTQALILGETVEPAIGQVDA